MSQVLDVINKNKSSLNNLKQNFDGLYFFNGKSLCFDERFKTLIDNLNTKLIADIKIDLKDEYYLGFMSGNKGCLIGELGITTFVYDEDEEGGKDYPKFDFFWWHYVDKFEAKYDPLYEQVVLLIQLSYGEGTFKRTSEIFGTSNLKALEAVERIFNQILKRSDIIIQHDYFHFDILFQENELNQLLVDLEEFKSKHYNDFSIIYDVYYKNKTKALIQLKSYEEAENLINSYYSYIDNNNKPYSSWIVELKAELSQKKGDYLQAVNSFSNCLEFKNIPSEYLEVYNKGLQASYDLLIKDFASIPAQRRKYIFVSDQLISTEMDGLVVLKQSALPDPKEIHFPLTHPHLNEVYTLHPINEKSYIPLKDYQKELFVDKLREFQILMDALGAKKIEIVNNNKTIDITQQKNKTSMDFKGSYMKIGGNVAYQNQNNYNHSLDQEINFLLSQKLNPKKMPHVPQNLVWYHTDLNWQRLAQQRMNGSLMEHRELISSKKIETLSSNELTKLNAELKILFFKASFDYKEETQINITSEKHYSLELKVEFEDTDVLKQNNNDYTNNQIKQENSNIEKSHDGIELYKEEVMFMLEDDGIIDENERRVLDRKMEKYGVSREEALEIESSLMFTPNEVKYLEEYKQLKDEGEIAEFERKILDRYAKRYEIDVERQKVLERSL